MDKNKAIKLLKQALSEIPHLRELHYDDQGFTLWRDKVREIIKAALDSDDLGRFSVGSWKIRGIFPDDAYQREYLDEHLPKYETALKSIIQKYEILGIEEKPAEKKGAKDTVALPIQLFDAMQFHPRVVKASKSLFADGYYAQAIFEAFKAVENFVKEKSGSTLYGKQLMATVFNEDKPIIQVPEAGHFDKDVQEGFKFLFMGGTLGIRNPKAHQEVIQKDPFITLEYLGFASFLIKRIDYWEVGTS